MTRRATAALLVAAVALTGCATSDPDVVATVDGTAVDAAEFQTLAEEFFGQPDVFGTTPPDQGRVDGDQTRFLLGLVVQQRLFRSFLDRVGVDATARRAEFIDANFTAGPIDDLSPEFLELAADVDGGFQDSALAEVAAPDPAELRAEYAGNPASTGAMCVRHILVETETEADVVLDELAAGADFATLAAERSIDPTAADGGGILVGPTGECIPLRTVLQSFDPGFTTAALAAREGVPSAPAQSSFGWHVILHRPWDEVGGSIEALHAPSDTGRLQFDGYAATSEVDIAPRLGNWSSVAGSVEPIG